MTKHNERCKECKKRVLELLQKIYGEGKVFQNHNINLPNKVEEFEQNGFTKDLEKIYKALVEYRAYDNFVKAKKLPNVDYYVKDNFILEYDESQHFTKPRLIALENYPDELSLGFDKIKWMDLCKKHDCHDNDPKDRDEQRAWYDTLRDFAPVFLGIYPTIRLYAADYVWCSLNADREEDVEKFKTFLEVK